MVFARIFHLHELVLALLDSGGIIVDLQRETLFLLLQMGKLVQHPRTPRFHSGKAPLQVFQLPGGGFQFLPHGKNFIVHFLEFDKLLNLIQIHGIAHGVPPLSQNRRLDVTGPTTRAQG